MSSPAKILPHYTYEDYCQWEGRWELIEGIPYAMSPAPTPSHQWVNANILGEFRNAIKKANCKNCKVYNFIDIKIAEDTILQPDAVIVCREIEKPFLDFAPALVVELLSPSTALKDRNNKFYIYEAFKIPYFIIVDVDKKEIEIYHLDNNGKYQAVPFSPENAFVFDLYEECNVEMLMNSIWE